MSRAEFNKPTRRAALKRSGGLCEAIGIFYGLASDTRCNVPLGNGVEFDHINQEANSHDNSLENCASVCKKCHAFKTAKHDTPRAAKTLRQQDKHNGIKSTKPSFQSKPFYSNLKSDDKAKRIADKHNIHRENIRIKYD